MSNPCQLYLITPPLAVSDLEAFAPRFQAALGAGLAASAMARIAPGAEGDGKRIVARLAEIAVANDVALLVEGDIRLAARAGADGVHVDGSGPQLAEALESLKPERIVGAGRLRLRDDAMSAGEAGVDYVMFGEPRPDGWTPPFEETLERTLWWADIFETPCVAYAAGADDAEALAAAGADFVALSEAIWSAADQSAAVAAVVARISRGGRRRA